VPLRGAENILRSYLAVRPGEVPLFAHAGAPAFIQALRAAASVVAPLEELDLLPFVNNPGGARSRFEDLLTPGRPTLWVTDGGVVPGTLTAYFVELAKRRGCRQVYISYADPLLLEHSLCADPAVIAEINTRLSGVLGRARELKVESPSGTDIRIELSAAFPLIQGDGRAESGQITWLPAGQVFTHPKLIEGVFVADRLLWIASSAGLTPYQIDRNAPPRFVIERSRVTSVTCEDAATAAAIDAYLASERLAARVGMIVLPTNYKLVSETGHRNQDRLLPGLNIHLGHAEAARTRAPFETNVMMAMYGRQQTVSVEGTKLIDAGRLSATLAR